MFVVDLLANVLNRLPMTGKVFKAITFNLSAIFVQFGHTNNQLASYVIAAIYFLSIDQPMIVYPVSIFELLNVEVMHTFRSREVQAMPIDLRAFTRANVVQVELIEVVRRCMLRHQRVLRSISRVRVLLLLNYESIPRFFIREYPAVFDVLRVVLIARIVTTKCLGPTVELYPIITRDI